MSEKTLRDVYTAAEVMNKITPADISDPQELIARQPRQRVDAGQALAPDE